MSTSTDNNEFNIYYREVACNSTTWSDPNADLCGCRGSGWWGSEVFTYHQCPHHFVGQCHPMDDLLEECGGGCDAEVDVQEPVVPQAPVSSNDEIPF